MSVSPAKQRYLILVGCALIVFLITFFSGPSAIWKTYQQSTSEKEKRERALRYHALANAELAMDDRSRFKSQEERLRLYYWFHARGWGIDEGHEDSSILDRWRDLIGHWKSNEKEANQAPEPTPVPIVAYLGR